MLARIYRPSKSAMQSGRANTRGWVLEFDPEKAKFVDPLMGWTGTTDMDGQVRLRFPAREDAERYAHRYHIPYKVEEPHERRVRPKSYAENFRHGAVK